MTVTDVTFILEECRDLTNNPDPVDSEDLGWSVRVQTPTGPLFLGSVAEYSEIGFKTCDEAIAGIRRWCAQRGFETPDVTFRVVGHRDTGD